MNQIAMGKKGFRSELCLLLLALICAFLLPCCKKTTEENSSANEKPESLTNTENMVLLDFELPKPVFIGTKENIRVRRLESLDKPRPPFYAPAGTENVAAGKPVTSTEPEPMVGYLNYVTDGDKEASEGCYVELGPSVQSVTIDLEAKYEIYAILFWHYHKQPRAYYDVVVQVADDPDFVANVRVLFNNDDDNSSGLGIGEDMHYIETHKGRLVDAKGVRARYVRLYSRGNSSDVFNHYTEVEVFGRPVK